MTFTVTKFTKGNTFAVTSRDSAEQAALQAAYAAAGFAAASLGEFADAGEAKTAKGNAVAALLSAGATLVPVADRPKAAREAKPRTMKAAKPMARAMKAGAPNQVEINRANAQSARRQRKAELAAKPRAVKARKAADPAKVAARQASKATRQAARKPRAPKK